MTADSGDSTVQIKGGGNLPLAVGAALAAFDLFLLIGYFAGILPPASPLLISVVVGMWALIAALPLVMGLYSGSTVYEVDGSMLREIAPWKTKTFPLREITAISSEVKFGYTPGTFFPVPMIYFWKGDEMALAFANFPGLGRKTAIELARAVLRRHASVQIDQSLRGQL